MIEYLAHALQIGLGLVFAAAVVSKVRSPRTFFTVMRAYSLVPTRVVVPAAIGVIMIEAFLSLALLSGQLVGIAAPVSVGLLVAFAVGIGVDLSQGRRHRCGCFGAEDEGISWRTLGRVGMLVAAGSTLVALELRGVSTWTSGLLGNGWEGLTHVLGALVLAGFLAVMGLWLLHVPELFALARAGGAIDGSEEVPAPGPGKAT
ncbi:MAG: MauE/DoxX family redox-associated membrane protein [Gemmatimonadaceae bacterium]